MQATFRADDSGSGIPQEARAHLFELFYRHAASAREVPGTGLGLAFCRGAVERMGGRIWMEDSQLGGAAFCFELPAG